MIIGKSTFLENYKTKQMTVYYWFLKWPCTRKNLAPCIYANRIRNQASQPINPLPRNLMKIEMISACKG